jgi:hypothetical protein
LPHTLRRTIDLLGSAIVILMMVMLYGAFQGDTR